jgi:hypothetical protein
MLTVFGLMFFVCDAIEGRKVSSGIAVRPMRRFIFGDHSYGGRTQLSRQLYDLCPCQPISRTNALRYIPPSPLDLANPHRCA